MEESVQDMQLSKELSVLKPIEIYFNTFISVPAELLKDYNNLKP